VKPGAVTKKPLTTPAAAKPDQVKSQTEKKYDGKTATTIKTVTKPSATQVSSKKKPSQIIHADLSDSDSAGTPMKKQKTDSAKDKKRKLTEDTTQSTKKAKIPIKSK